MIGANGILSQRAVTTSLVVIGLSTAVIAGLAAWRTPMTPDSWTIYDQAQAIAGGGPVLGLRQFRISTDATIAFPPLFTLLVAGVQGVAGLGIRAGMVASWLACIGLLAMLYVLATRLVGAGVKAQALWVAAIASLLTNWFFLEEIVAGRAMSASAALMLCAIVMFLTGSAGSRLGGIAYGLVLGAAVMTRLDTLTFALVMLAGATCFCRGIGWAFAVICFGIALSPLVYDSWTCCGRVLATETSGIATSAIRLHPTTFLDTVAPTLFDAPLLYAKRLIESAFAVARRSAVAVAVSPGLVLLLVYLLRGPNRLALLRQSLQPKDLLVIAALASMFVPPWLLSFDDRRYFVVPILFSSFIVCGRLLKSTDIDARAWLAITLVPSLLVGFPLSVYGLFRAQVPADLSAAHVACLEGARTLVLGEQGPEIAARLKVRAVIEPDNWAQMVSAERQAFYAWYGITRAFDPERGDCIPLP